MRTFAEEVRPYQEETIRRMVQHQKLAILADPGLGKTMMTLEAFRRLRSWCEVRSMLVVAPLRVCYSGWPAEVREWDVFQDLRVQVLHGPTLTRRHLAAGADVYVTNYESLAWLERQDWPGGWPEILAVDESTRIKKVGSLRSKRCARIAPMFSRIYELTGTPAPNGLDNLHGQIYLLDGGEALFQDFDDFKAQYMVCIPTGSLGYTKWRMRPRAGEEIFKRIAPLCVRLDAKDHLQLPPVVNTTIDVDLPEEVKEQYDTLRREMVVNLERGEIVALNAGALTSKCRQFANGVVYLTPEGLIADKRTRESAVVHTAKVAALVDLVEELGGQPLLVAYEHASEVPVLRKALKHLCGDVPYLGGGVSGPDGDAIIRRWNNGELRVLLVQPQSGSLGLNLQAGGHHIAWFALPYDLEHYDQMIKRLHRSGQKAAHVMVYHFVTRGTVDPLILRALARKDAEQRELLDYLRADLAARPAPPA